MAELTNDARRVIAEKFNLTGIPADHHILRGADKMVYSITAILVAWQAGELSEGQAAQLMCCDRVRLRQLLNELNAEAQIQWEQWRKDNPPQEMNNDGKS